MSIFDVFRLKKQPSDTGTSHVSPPKPPVDRADMERIANLVYPGLTIYVRDINLKKEWEDQYIPGRILRAKAFTDASSRVMGMITSHRYMILSNHMADFSAFEHGTNWGLHVANRDSHFMVLGKHVYKGKTAIVLLHLPDSDDWKFYLDCRFSLDEKFCQMAIERFEAKCEEAPIPELSTAEWLNRCAFPIGMDNHGHLWPLEQHRIINKQTAFTQKGKGCLFWFSRSLPAGSAQLTRCTATGRSLRPYTRRDPSSPDGPS